MENSVVCHEGIVVDKNNNEIIVMIEAKSACGGCAIKSACNMSETANKRLTVSTDSPDQYTIGEKVMVTMSGSQGGKATIYAYLIPSVILIVAILIFSCLQFNEGLGALLSLALLVTYYFILYLNRDKLKSKFSFEIKHLQ